MAEKVNYRTENLHM